MQQLLFFHWQLAAVVVRLSWGGVEICRGRNPEQRRPDHVGECSPGSDKIPPFVMALHPVDKPSEVETCLVYCLRRRWKENKKKVEGGYLDAARLSDREEQRDSCLYTIQQ